MLSFRRYEEADFREVWDIHNLALSEAGVHLGNGPWDDDLRHIEATYINVGGDFLAGTHDSAIVAMGALKKIDKAAAEIKRMRVLPEFQRRGFGMAMLMALERRARDLGYDAVQLDTPVLQAAARSLYEKNGYSEMSRGMIRDLEIVYFSKKL